MPQYTALTTYMYAVSDLEPVRTAFEAVRSCIGTYGQHYPDFILRIRAEFLAAEQWRRSSPRRRPGVRVGAYSAGLNATQPGD